MESGEENPSISDINMSVDEGYVHMCSPTGFCVYVYVPTDVPIHIAHCKSVSESETRKNDRKTNESFARFEVFTSVSMKYAVLLDIKTQFVLRGNTLRLRYRAQPASVM
jgi:hypothetical protein